MRIRYASVFVDDQAKALAFYTDMLGFVKKVDIPVGEFRWLTVVSPEGPDDLELVLEPNAHDAAKAYQRAIHADGIPATMFICDDLAAEYKRLTARGVEFRSPPTTSDAGTDAIVDDTCGNLILLHQNP